jgi:hypothetical protein
MKNMLTYRFIFLLLVGSFLYTVGFNSVYAQEGEKNSVRFKAYYTKIMDSVSYFNVTAFSRIDKENVDVAIIDMTFYNELDDDEIE